MTRPLKYFGDHTFWIRVPNEIAMQVVEEAGALGIPQTEFFRRCIALYFETKAGLPPRGPALTPEQIPPLDPDASEDEKFNLGDK
jgi:hypothetical protein